MAIVEVTLVTGGDDLRGGSWANLVVKLVGHSPIRFEKFTGVNGLGGGTVVTTTVDVPPLNDPNQIEFFQIEHISQESFGQTRDNWNMESVQFAMRFGRFKVVVAEHGFHRFDGATPTLIVLPPNP
jgi:hypothetical protein